MVISSFVGLTARMAILPGGVSVEHLGPATLPYPGLWFSWQSAGSPRRPTRQAWMVVSTPFGPFGFDEHTATYTCGYPYPGQ